MSELIMLDHSMWTIHHKLRCSQLALRILARPIRINTDLPLIANKPLEKKLHEALSIGARFELVPLTIE